MRYTLTRFGTWMLIVLMLFGSASAQTMHQAVNHPTLAMEVTVGYDGLMTYGKTMPITVRLENSGEDFAGTVAINIYHDLNTYNRYEVSCTLASGAVKELLIPVKVLSKQETFTVEMVQDGQTVCAVNSAPQEIVNPNAMLIGVLSPDPQALNYMTIDAESDELRRYEYARVIPLSEATFPQNLEQLNAFGMLVIEGFDVNRLKAEQRQALIDWLRSGHVLFLGGGAQASVTWPAFASLTGLTLEETALYPDITPALADFLGAANTTLSQEILLARPAQGQAIASDGDIPLIWRTAVDAGCIYTTAFELGAAPMTSWRLMHTFWQRLLTRDNSTLLQEIMYTNSYEYDALAYRASRIPADNTSGLLGAVITCAVVLLAGSIGAYFFFKRIDRRQWLWLALPCAALVSAAAVGIIAFSGSVNQPLALSVSAMRQSADGTRWDASFATVATARQGEQLVTVREGSLRPYSTRSYESYSDKQVLEPTLLNYRYLQGEENGVGLNFVSSWSSQTFAVEDVPHACPNLESRLWREDDGLHGIIVNTTGLHLSEGAVISRYGYCSIPALSPGDQAEFTLKNAAFADPDKPVYEDGCMYESLAGGYADVYTIVNEYFYQPSQRKEGELRSPTEEESLRGNLMSLVINQDYDRFNGYTASLFHYVAFSDELRQPALSLDGEPLRRSFSRGVVCAGIPLETVSEAGLVYRAPGMDPAMRCQADDSGAPYVDASASQSQKRYHRVADNPVFAFDLSELHDVQVQRLVIYSEYYLRNVTLLVWNGSSWDEHKLGENIAQPDTYIQPDGMLYIRFRSDGADEYMEINTPTMLLEGKVK